MELTKEQAIFYIYMNKIKSLENQTPVDVNQIREYKAFLWEKIYKFARSEINQMMGEFTSKEEREDAQQSLAAIFFEKLPHYNPLQTTPTTYFVRFFRQEISKHIRTYRRRLTQYDAINARKISAVVNEYEKQGVHPTLDVISRKTNLSQKVIKSTLFYSSNAKMANVDEALDISSKLPTPEQSIIISEEQKTLADSFLKNTSELERRLLMLRVNPDGKKYMPYDKIAEETGIPIREVKSIINQAICNLNQDKKLRSVFGHGNRYSDIKPVVIQDDAAEIMEKRLEQFLAVVP